MSIEPLRLMLFDTTCRGRGVWPGLSAAWSAGERLYRGLGRLDAARGVTSWAEGLTWLVEQSRAMGRPIGEVQYWGHGRRGRAMVDDDHFDARSLLRGGALRPDLDDLRTALLPDGTSTLWFRTCETLGGRVGQDFAVRLAEHLRCRVAGHTHVIGFWQSGLHSLRPGEHPSWSIDEGLREGTSEAEIALDSSPFRTNTIHCLQGVIPSGY